MKNKQGSRPKLKKIDERHPSYDPAQYVVMFPHGDQGWGPNYPLLERNHEDIENIMNFQ